MTALTTRAAKGSRLTNAEVDANFTGLNTDKVEKASNLSDLANAATARTNLGLGSVTNTSDAAKPVSTAQQVALDLKAPLASPGFTGAPTAPTAATGTNSLQLATTAFVQTSALRDLLATTGSVSADGLAKSGLYTAFTPGWGTDGEMLHLNHNSNAAYAVQILASNWGSAGLRYRYKNGGAWSAAKLIAEVDSPTFTGTPGAPTAAIGTNTTQIASTAFVLGQAAATSSPMDGAAAVGTSTRFARQDHVHPTDTSRAPVSASTAAGTSVTPAGSIAATDVQAALQELDSEKATAAQGALADSALQADAIGASVQGYDADTAKTNVAQNYTLPQRSALLTDNNGAFDLADKQNFKCTLAAGATLTFFNQADGLSGSVIFINGANYAVAANANTQLTTADLAKLSSTGTYRIDYLSDGTNAYCSVVGSY